MLLKITFLFAVFHSGIRPPVIIPAASFRNPGGRNFLYDLFK
jgi:hypothetical protein